MAGKSKRYSHGYGCTTARRQIFQAKAALRYIFAAMKPAKTIHALLIGINAYPSGALQGCVNDALAVGTFFRDTCTQTGYRWRPLYLLAPAQQDLSDIEAAGVKSWDTPTRSGIIDAFDHFNETEVQSEDICLIYFSGHGSQEPAAAEFHHLKADGNAETLVCLDSRQPGGRDLVDKDIAWLLWRITREHPTAHVLVVMDCCHSGDNTRSITNSVRERRITARQYGTSFAELLDLQGSLGAGTGLFSLHNGRADYRIEGRYVHLAAARDQETAKELCINGRPRGIFTWSLLRVLEHGGLGLSCREVLSRTETLVRLRVQGQIPQLYASPPEKANQEILGSDPGEASLGYPVFYKNGVWRMRAGNLQGITPGTVDLPLLVALVNGSRACIKALEVGPNFTVLDPLPFSKTDRHEDHLAATIRQMPIARLRIFRMLMPAQMAEELEFAIGKRNLFYADFRVGEAEEADYLVMAEGEYFLLIPPGGNRPVFRRQNRADDFVQACEHLGKWKFALELQNLHSSLHRSDVELWVEKIEGKLVSPQTLNSLQGEILTNPAAVELCYVKTGDKWLAPALRCAVRVKKSGYWVGGLFLDSRFGIADYLEPRPLEAGQEHLFRFPFQGTLYNAIPLMLDAQSEAQGLEETVDYLKIFVANSDFKLDFWRQDPLPPDEGALRQAGFSPEPISGRPDWMTITIPVFLTRR